MRTREAVPSLSPLPPPPFHTVPLAPSLFLPSPSSALRSRHTVLQLVRLNVPDADVRLRIPLATAALRRAEAGVRYGIFTTRRELTRGRALFCRWRDSLRPRARQNSWRRSRRWADGARCVLLF